MALAERVVRVEMVAEDKRVKSAAVDLGVHLDHQVLQDSQDQLAEWANAVALASQVSKDHKVSGAQLEKPDVADHTDKRENGVTAVSAVARERKDAKESMDATAHQEITDVMDQRDDPAEMVLLDVREVRATLDAMAVMDKLD